MFFKSQKGITLLELLVALAVFSISAIAILDTIGATSRIVSELEQKTLSHWVAGNRLSDIGVTRSEVNMADRQWYLETTVEKTARADMRRITVAVRLNKEHESPIVSRLAFAGKTQ